MAPLALGIGLGIPFVFSSGAAVSEPSGYILFENDDRMLTEDDTNLIHTEA